MSFLESQLVFYGSYHHNKVNVFTHIICVPLLLWSLEVGFARVGFELAAVKPLASSEFHFALNLPFLFSLLYSIYYVSLDAIPGLAYAPILIAISQHATFYSQSPQSGTNAFIIHIVSWAAQFLSHGLAEKRAPALFDGLVQAVTLAPFFIFYEVLFYLGFKRELQDRINAKISRNVGAYRAQLLKAEKAQ